MNREAGTQLDWGWVGCNQNDDVDVVTGVN